VVAEDLSIYDGQPTSVHPFFLLLQGHMSPLFSSPGLRTRQACLAPLLRALSQIAFYRRFRISFRDNRQSEVRLYVLIGDNANEGERLGEELNGRAIIRIGIPSSCSHQCCSYESLDLTLFRTAHAQMSVAGFGPIQNLDV
jgi:hypothetical protein